MLEDWNEELTKLNKHSITETKAMAFVEIEVQKNLYKEWLGLGDIIDKILRYFSKFLF